MTTEDAMRVVGFLLQFHPTRFALARNSQRVVVPAEAPEASCWCLLGAILVVQVRILNQPWSATSSSLLAKTREFLETPSITALWDEAYPVERAQIIAKLKSAA